MNKYEFVPTVALDFDGVIHKFTSTWTVPEEVLDGPTEGALEAVRSYIKDGLKVVVYSARAQDPAGLEAIKVWLAKHQFPELEVTSLKPGALVYVDDRGICFNGTWPTSQEIRRFVPWNRRTKWGTLKDGKQLVKKITRARELRELVQDKYQHHQFPEYAVVAELCSLLEELGI